MSKQARHSAVECAISVADDIAEGRIQADDLERAAADAVRELAGLVIGPDDPVWPVQVDIARQVLALGGVPYNELAEWLAIHRDRPQIAAIAQPGALSDNPSRTPPSTLTSGDGAAGCTALGECEALPGAEVVESDAPISLLDGEATARKMGCESPAVCSLTGCQDPGRCRVR